jgi:hypothetical protein
MKGDTAAGQRDFSKTLDGEAPGETASLCCVATCRRIRTELSAMVSVAVRLADGSGKQRTGRWKTFTGNLCLGDCYG